MRGQDEHDRRNAWYKQMRDRGILVLSEEDYVALSDTVSLLALAVRRQHKTNMFGQSVEYNQLIATYKTFKEKFERCVSSREFNAQDKPLPQPDNLIYFDKERRDRGK